MSRVLVVTAIMAAGLLAHACGGGERLDPELERLGRASGPADPGATRPPGSAELGGAPVGAGAGRVHAGRVAETIQVPDYTYIRMITADGGELWTAVPAADVSAGQEARVVESLVMTDFTSRTLSRTFERIVFGVLEDQASPAADDAPDTRPQELPPGHPPIDAE